MRPLFGMLSLVIFCVGEPSTLAQPLRAPPAAPPGAAAQVQRCKQLIDAHRYPEALEVCPAAVRAVKQAHGDAHPRTAEPLAMLAQLRFSLGAYAPAEALYREAIQNLAPVQAAYPQQTSALQSALAAVLNSQGKYQQVEEIYTKEISFVSKEKPLRADRLIPLLNNLAEFYRAQARYDRAEQTLQEALSLLSAADLKAERWHAHVLNSLGELHREQGRMTYAEMFLRSALEMRRRILPPSDPDIAITLNNYAELLRERGRYDEAEPLYQQALTIRRQSVGVEHPHYASTLENLGRLQLARGDLSGAEERLREALALRARSVGAQHPLYAKTLCGLAELLRTRGQFAEAQTLLGQALTIRRSVFGPQHIQVGLVEHELGLVALGRGDTPAAVAHIQRALEIEERILTLAAGEARLLALVDKYQTLARHAYSLLLSSDAAAQQLAIRLVLARKGRWLDAGLQAAQAARQSHGDDALLEMLRTLRGQLVARLLGNQAQGNGATDGRVSALQAEIDELERRLQAARGEGVRTAAPPPLASIIEQVTARLDPSSMLVEFVRLAPYAYTSSGTNEPQRWGPARYAAIVLTKKTVPRIYDLGSARDIEGTVARLMSLIYDQRSAPVSAAQSAYQFLISKFKKTLANFKTIYLSTDAILNTLPFYALHDGRDYLIDKHEFVYLTSGRDLLRDFPVPSQTTPRTALLFADPAYHTFAASTPLDGTGEQPVAERSAERSAELLQMAVALAPLPGSQAEVAAIARYLPGAQILTGADASEMNLRRAHAPWILHLAMHAGVGNRPPPERPLSAPAPKLPPEVPLVAARGMVHAVGPAPLQTPPIEEAAVDLPQQMMTRSALFLSGAAQAERTPDAASDGILTAEEARYLDLQGTALVVLSACESGLGVLHASHGVFGLRRAFLLTGAESIVTSLWKIDDVATADQMADFYRELLVARRPRAAALRASMRSQRARHPHPYYWAAFVLIGRSDPL